MPHIIVKMYAGRSEAEKSALAEEITRAVTKTLGYGPNSVSVGIEDVAPKDWAENVFKPDITGKAATLYKQPGYKLSDL
ncbi:tautomerase family protein [Rhizobium jaguaris]|uniref:4-oxalocrotonate tautomerase n=1 Tax=Rhizobium jaguaris TaxID=1312183 RepID=A0A387FYI4_9HYPH|nr:tautomerase family protein [Rhizobium jaguaris]AYG62285.1 4-oxalocrotonate tautomerase [Rhizobium jaguaris]